ncbi:hypothetical protein P7C73_g1123, partial [Tremellales sp. Uapishka_1]
MSSRLSHDFPHSSSQSFSQPRRSHSPSPYGAYSDPQPADFYEPGEERDEPFDVRADFDGDGPRWSEVYGSGAGNERERERERVRGDGSSYRPISNHVAPAGLAKKDIASGEELVSVPVLGPDLALVLFFVLPRAPSFSFYDQTPFTVDNSTVSFSRTPANYSFTGNMNLLADATNSYLPVHFSSLEATLYDLTTSKAIATGNYGNHFVKKAQNVPVVIPIEFSYAAPNSSDTTWLDMYNACEHIYQGTTRPSLGFRVIVKMSIIGLVTHPESSAIIDGVTCPFERASNSV